MKRIVAKLAFSVSAACAIAPLALAQSAPTVSPPASNSARASAQANARTSAPAPASSSLNLQLPSSQNMPDEDDPPKTAHDSNTSVHGEVSTMVGYSKGYGTSTAEGMNLDVDHRTDNGNHVGMSISVVQGRNLPYYGYPGYGGYPAYGYGRRAWAPAPSQPASASSGGE